MIVDAEFTFTVKIQNFPMSDGISWMEMKERLLQEGDKRMRYYTSGFLQDPEGKVISKDVTYKIKEN